MDVNIVIDESSLEMAESGAIWGGVWLDMDGRPFPEVGWNDLPVAVYVEIISAVRAVRLGARKANVRFYDGPFWIDFLRSGAESFAIATSDSTSAACDASEFSKFASRLERSALKLVSDCRDRGWSQQDDVRRLESLSAR